MGRNPDEPYPETVMVALAVDGIVTRTALLRAGIADHIIGRRVDTGFLVRVKPGIFRLAGTTLHGRTALRAALALGRGAVISHWTAAWLDGYTRGVEPKTVHVTLPDSGYVESTDWCATHATRRLLRGESTVRNGIHQTTVPRTIRDIVAALPSDPRADREVTRVIEEALQLKKTTLERLETYARDETSPVIGSRLQRLVGVQRGMPDPALLRSKGEEWLRDLLIRNGLPLPEFNHVVHGFEMDTVWIDRRLNIEFDGFAFRRVRTKHDSDRRRDRTLLLNHFRVARITDTDFDTLAALESEVIRLLQLPPIPARDATTRQIQPRAQTHVSSTAAAPPRHARSSREPKHTCRAPPPHRHDTPDPATAQTHVSNTAAAPSHRGGAARTWSVTDEFGPRRESSQRGDRQGGGDRRGWSAWREHDPRSRTTTRPCGPARRRMPRPRPIGRTRSSCEES